MSSTPTSQWRELARRSGGGVELTVLWDDRKDLVKVAVSDGRLCHHVNLAVDDGRALAAFHRAFADASVRMRANDATDEFWGFGPSLGEAGTEEEESA